LLVFVSCSIDRLDSSVDLDNVPEFVELTNSPISKVLLSAISLRMNENTEQSAGFTRVMSLVNDLINDNRKQLQQIRRLNQRVEGQCLVSNNKLVNRERNFATLLNYFKSRGQLALSEKTEAVDMQASRRTQAAFFTAAQQRFNAAFTQRVNKWTNRVADLNNGVNYVSAALKAVANWTPSTRTSFIEENIKQAVAGYEKSMNYPLSYDSEMIQLAASDNRVKQRLYEWLNMLKSSMLNQLTLAQDSLREVQSSHNLLNSQLTQVVNLENSDVTRLGGSIQNWTVLIQNYSSNEKIYSALNYQTQSVLRANRQWCKVEGSNYVNNRQTMENQLNVFVQLKQWLRKNYSRVRQWLRKRYNQ